MRELKATLQKSYYGKARIDETPHGFILYSYNTPVCVWQHQNGGEFIRLWSGWSHTSAKHINDFRRLFGLPALSKKEWLALDCFSFENGNIIEEDTYSVYISTGFYTHGGTALLTEEEARREVERLENQNHGLPRCVWYE